MLLRLKETQTPLGHWLNTLLGRSTANVAVVALASKLAADRLGMLRHRTDFDRRAFAGA